MRRWLLAWTLARAVTTLKLSRGSLERAKGHNEFSLAPLGNRVE